MTKFVHIVYVHPVENGEPNLYKVELEREFRLKEEAERWFNMFNAFAEAADCELKAVYLGRVNDATGELV